LAVRRSNTRPDLIHYFFKALFLCEILNNVTFRLTFCGIGRWRCSGGSRSPPTSPSTSSRRRTRRSASSAAHSVRRLMLSRSSMLSLAFRSSCIVANNVVGPDPQAPYKFWASRILHLLYGSGSLHYNVAYPGSVAFLTPGSGMGKKSGYGSVMNNPDHISECLAWLRIRIGSGFNRVSGSGSGSRRAKMTHKS
jgi:hypothetical protein